jgi:hypothetical protein
LGLSPGQQDLERGRLAEGQLASRAGGALRLQSAFQVSARSCDGACQLGLLALEQLQGAGNVPDGECQVSGLVGHLHEVGRRLPTGTDNG